MKRLVIYFHYDPAGRIHTACRIACTSYAEIRQGVICYQRHAAPADRVWVRQSVRAASNGKYRL